MKKGFTLIELLAVIIVIGIIALIAVPLTSSLIESSRKKGLRESAENYIEALEYSISIININKNFNPTTCVVQTSGNAICDGVSVEVELTKAIPTSGIVKLKNGIMESVKDLKIKNSFLSTDENKEFIVK